MSQTAQLLQALKHAIRTRGLTYRDIASQIDISESSLKRWFSDQSVTLKRLEDICNVLEINILELAKLTDMYKAEKVAQLSLEQEEQLAADPQLLSYFYLLINSYTPDSIRREFEVDELAELRFLTQLDRMGLIELHPGNRVRLRCARIIQWREGGPVRRAYETMVKNEFLHDDFGDAYSHLHFCTGELCDASLQILDRKVAKLVEAFNDLAEGDLVQPSEQKRGVGLMIGFRPWVFSLFTKRKSKPAATE